MILTHTLTHTHTHSHKHTHTHAHTLIDTHRHSHRRTHTYTHVIILLELRHYGVKLREEDLYTGHVRPTRNKNNLLCFDQSNTVLCYRRCLRQIYCATGLCQIYCASGFVAGSDSETKAFRHVCQKQAVQWGRTIRRKSPMADGILVF